MRIRSLLIAAVFVLTVVPVALAVDSKTFNGSQCAPLSNLSNAAHFVEGFWVLATSGSDEATCPITRDNTTNTTGATDLEMRVTLGDPGTAICNAVAMTSSGSSLISVTRSRSTTGLLDWGTSINTSSSKGTYAIRCDMPAFWLINSYFIDEP